MTRVARKSASLAPDADFDRSVPVVLLKIGRYPLHHGGVGAIRSLGRAGVSVYAVIEDRLTPAALSRYARGTVIWPTSGREQQERLVEGLVAVARQLGERSVLLCTDDEAAVLVAEHREVLSEWFILPPVPPDLPRRLTSKRALGALCEEIRDSLAANRCTPDPGCARGFHRGGGLSGGGQERRRLDPPVVPRGAGQHRGPQPGRAAQDGERLGTALRGRSSGIHSVRRR